MKEVYDPTTAKGNRTAITPDLFTEAYTLALSKNVAPIS